MKPVIWDYDLLAASYDERPDYAPNALQHVLDLTAIAPESTCCDVGAGTGRLTVWLLQAGHRVFAVEPSSEMRAIGQHKTAEYGDSVTWIESTAEANPLPDASCALVTFGSSLNVTERDRSLRETARILQPDGWFVCMWNHRDLEDPLQAEIENLIKREVPDYAYGTRRDDQTEAIEESGLFETPVFFERRFNAEVRVDSWLAAWRSHATLARQAGDKMPDILAGIEAVVRKRSSDVLSVAYVTRVWAARVLSGNDGG